MNEDPRQTPDVPGDARHSMTGHQVPEGGHSRCSHLGENDANQPMAGYQEDAEAHVERKPENIGDESELDPLDGPEQSGDRRIEGHQHDREGKHPQEPCSGEKG